MSIGRRTLLIRWGRTAAGLLVLGTGAACGSEPAVGPAGGGGSPDAGVGDAPAPAGGGSSPDAGAGDTAAPAGEVDELAWQRVALDFVSAYVLARGNEAAVVDTGVAGSEDAIQAGLSALGLGWDAVGHVLLTHKHADHAGSIAAVLAAAPDAAAYAGEADIPAITAPRTVQPVGDGDRVFDLEIVATPGHTPGHVSVLDRTAGLLVAGDALSGAGGGVTGPNAQFTEDLSTAAESVRKLAGLPFDTVVFGHGEPVIGNASAEVGALVTGG